MSVALSTEAVHISGFFFNEIYWPGQSKQLYAPLTSPKKLVEFTEADGADLHCEPKGTGIRDLRVFNWLDETMNCRG